MSKILKKIAAAREAGAQVEEPSPNGYKWFDISRTEIDGEGELVATDGILLPVKAKAKRTRKAKQAVTPTVTAPVTPPVDGQEQAPANVQSAAAKLAQARELTGEGHRLTVMRPNWAQLCQECVNIKIRVRFWHAAEKLTVHTLGLDSAPPEFQAFAHSYLKLGQIRLAPSRYTKALDCAKQNAMNHLNRVSYSCPWGGRMAVLKAYPGLREKLEQFQNDAQEANERFAGERIDWEPELRAEYRKLVGLQLALRSGQAAGTAELSPELTEQVDTLIGGLMANVKSAAEIAELFEFSWVPSYVRAPNLSEGGADLQALEDRVLASQEYLDAINQKIATGQADQAEILSGKKIEAELAAQREQLAIQTQIARDVAEKAAGEQIKQINGVLDGAAARLAGLFYQVAAEVRSSLAERGRKGYGGATKAHARKLQEVVEQVSVLNAWNDPNVNLLADKLADLAASLEKSPDQADAESLDRTLADVQALVGADLIALGNPEEISDLEIPGAADVLVSQRVAEAADRLGLLEFGPPELVLSPASEDGGERLGLLEDTEQESVLSP